MFASLDSFSSLASLFRISPAFHDIENFNAHTVYLEIAGRTFSFPENLELSELQAGVLEVPGVTREAPEYFSCRREASIAHAKHFAANHRIALLACQSWQAHNSDSYVFSGDVDNPSL